MTTTRVREALVPLLVAALLAAAGCGNPLAGPAGGRYSAMMSTATGLYPDADVRVLGVPVGQIDAVEPQGDLVRVDFHLDQGVQVPAAATAAVVAPTVVADRYLQLSPVYTGGPTLAEGAVIPKERTASPAEFDDLLAATQKLSTALGPQGVNANGALSEALTTVARNLDGNGQRLNTTLDNTAQAINTLAANREDLAGTIRNLQSFTTNLKGDDPQVRAFTEQFAQVNGFLAGERQNLGQTLKELSEALGEVARFVHDNRAEVKENVEQLSSVLETINGERLALEQALETAPMGLDGLVNAYNAGTGTLDTRTDLLSTLFQLLFGAIGTLVPGGQQLFCALLDGAFPNGHPLSAACAALPAPTPATTSSLKLSSGTAAQLTDPKVMGALMDALRRREASRPATHPAPPAGAPAATAPGGPRDRRAHGPGRAPATLDDLFGGGR